VNDNSPGFVSASKISIVNTEGVGAWIHTFIAVDVDGGVNGVVTYSISTFGVNDEGTFALDAHSGHLTIKKGLKTEYGSTYGLNITAADGGSPSRSTTQEFHVMVDELEMRPPRFEKRRYMAKVQENSLKGTPVVKVGAYTGDRREFKFYRLLKFKVWIRENYGYRQQIYIVCKVELKKGKRKKNGKEIAKQINAALGFLHPIFEKKL